MACQYGLPGPHLLDDATVGSLSRDEDTIANGDYIRIASKRGTEGSTNAAEQRFISKIDVLDAGADPGHCARLAVLQSVLCAFVHWCLHSSSELVVHFAT